jgi:hypothetical protein
MVPTLIRKFHANGTAISPSFHVYRDGGTGSKLWADYVRSGEDVVPRCQGCGHGGREASIHTDIVGGVMFRGTGRAK